MVRPGDRRARGQKDQRVEQRQVPRVENLGALRRPKPAGQFEARDLPDKFAGQWIQPLLRSASGYIAKPRSGTVGASSFDRILIMPASRPPAMSAAAPTFNARPQPTVVMPNVVIDDDEPNGVMPPGMPPPPQQFPGQPPVQPGMQPGQAVPAMPTLTRPGMLPPPAPNVPGNPYQTNPQQPIIRPPGVPGPGGA
jgi:hypothetical protein